MEKQTVTISPGFEEQREYDDDAWTVASNELIEAVGAMVEAGASSAEIADTVRNGLENSI